MPEFIINVKSKGAKKASSEIGLLTGSIKKMGLQAAAAAVTWQTVTSAISKSAELEGVKRGFDNLTRASGFSGKAFQNFNKALDGTVDKLTLMKTANSAMLLGVAESEAQMAQMFDISQRLGQSLGIETTHAIESLVTGLGRQSKLMLDNLGIMVDMNDANEKYAASVGKTTSQLTDQDKKLAFTNEAMTQAKNLVDMLGEENLTTKDKIAQLNSAVESLLISFGQLLTPILIPLAEVLKFTAEHFGFLFEAISGAGTSFKGSATGLAAFKAEIEILAKQGNLDAVRDKMKSLEGESERLQTRYDDMHDIIFKVNGQHTETGKILGIVNENVDENNQLTHISSENMGDWGQIVVDNLLGMDEFIEKENEKIQLTYQDNTATKAAMMSEKDLIDVKLRLIMLILKNTGALDKERQAMINTLSASGKLAAGLGALNSASKGSALATARLQQAGIGASTAAGAMAAISPPTGAPTPAGWLNFSAVIAAGLAQAIAISQSVGDFKTAATGMNEVVNSPTMILAGEAGAEQVSITPLEGPNTEGPQGQSVNINFSGNVLSRDFIEDEAIPAIREAIRRGASLEVN